MRTRLAGTAVLTPLLLFPLYWTNAVRGHDFDDPYITYRYALNVANGQGFVYNHGLKLLSTTTPGYTLLMALLSHFSSNLPIVSNVLGSLCLLLGACLFINLLPASIPIAWRVTAGVFLALMKQPMATLGSEFPLYMLLILLACWLYERDKPVAAGFAAGLATLVRPDGAVIVVSLLGMYVLQRKVKDAFKALAACLIPLVPWCTFALVYFGSFIPVTLGAKQSQVHVNGGYGFLRGLATTLNFVRKDYGNVEFVLIGVLILAGVWWLVGQQMTTKVPAAPAPSPFQGEGWGGVPRTPDTPLPPPLSPPGKGVKRGVGRTPPLLIVWAAVYITGYSIIGVRYYFWYYAPLFSTGVYLMVVGLRSIYEQTTGTDGQHRAFARAIAGIVAVSLLFVAGRTISEAASRRPEAELNLYRRTGDWLNANTPANATVGALQIGIIGYYAHRPIIDFAGLIQPDVHRAGGKDYIDWSTYAIQKYRPDYIALDTPWGGPIATAPWFTSEYNCIETLHSAVPTQGMQIWRRK